MLPNILLFSLKLGERERERAGEQDWTAWEVSEFAILGNCKDKLGKFLELQRQGFGLHKQVTDQVTDTLQLALYQGAK